MIKEISYSQLRNENCKFKSDLVAMKEKMCKSQQYAEVPSNLLRKEHEMKNVQQNITDVRTQVATLKEEPKVHLNALRYSTKLKIYYDEENGCETYDSYEDDINNAGEIKSHDDVYNILRYKNQIDLLHIQMKEKNKEYDLNKDKLSKAEQKIEELTFQLKKKDSKLQNLKNSVNEHIKNKNEWKETSEDLAYRNKVLVEDLDKLNAQIVIQNRKNKSMKDLVETFNEVLYEVDNNLVSDESYCMSEKLVETFYEVPYEDDNNFVSDESYGMFENSETFNEVPYEVDNNFVSDESYCMFENSVKTFNEVPYGVGNLFPCMLDNSVDEFNEVPYEVDPDSFSDGKSCMKGDSEDVYSEHEFNKVPYGVDPNSFSDGISCMKDNSEDVYSEHELNAVPYDMDPKCVRDDKSYNLNEELPIFMESNGQMFAKPRRMLW